VRAHAYLELCVQKLNFNPAICEFYAEKGLALFDRHGSELGAANAYVKLAAAQRLLGKTEKGLASIKKALRVAEKYKNRVLLAYCHHELALASLNQNDLDGALRHNLQALDLYRLCRMPHEVSGILNNVGILYAQKGAWEEAIRYFREALRTETDKNDKVSIGNELNNIGVFFIFKHDLDSAEYYLRAGMKMREEAKDNLGICGSYNNLALLEAEKGRLDKALELARIAYDKAVAVKSLKEELEVLNSFYEIYLKKGDYKNALEYFTKQVELKKKSDLEANNRRLVDIQSSIEIEKKERELLEKNLQLDKNEQETRRKNYVLLGLGSGFLLLTMFSFYAINTNKKIKKANSIISEQKNIIEEKHKDITDSIDYAQKIQQALVLSERQLSANLGAESFVLFKPRDIVSGDFYWYSKKGDTHLLAAADCTGHGVPGAFMSMIGITLLNQVVNEKNVVRPDEILNQLRSLVITALSQKSDEGHRRDGMDMSMVALNGSKLLYAGANNACLLLRRGGVIEELTPDKQPVGLHEKLDNFTLHTVAVNQGDMLYLFSDGIIDQFGGEKNKKLKMPAFRQWLAEAGHKDCSEQRTVLEEKLTAWQGNNPQTDDILVIGIRC
jgi:serine phosphatase RsbU (regulator of sigma subunit)/Flp pilus assembly protein TadD